MIDPDDLAAFRAAVADAQPLPAVNRVQLKKSPARRLMPTVVDTHAANVAPRKHREPDLPASWQAGEPRREPTLDPEQAAFRRAMQGVARLAEANRVVHGTLPPAPRPKQHLADERAALHESLHGQIGLQDRLEGGDEANYLRPGLANTVLRDLRRGRWVIQAEIDLHGLNRDDARQQLAGLLAECLHLGRRCVRVIHGKGHGSPQKLSILRHLVRGWLAQRSEVLAYCQARPYDGGGGALLVLLQAAKKQGRP